MLDVRSDLSLEPTLAIAVMGEASHARLLVAGKSDIFLRRFAFGGMDNEGNLGKRHLLASLLW